MNKNKIIAIIPARGGSKGIQHKNVQIVAGKPLIAYTIENSLKISSIERTLVSTDDSEIGKISEQFGAEIIWRPKELSGDNDSSELALLHSLEFLKNTEDYEPDILVFLQCTSPLTLKQDIEGTIESLFDEKADTSLSVSFFNHFLWEINRNGNAVGINHDKTRRVMRQQMESQYIENGAVYVMRVAGFIKAKHRFFGKTSIYVMPKERCFEIDNLFDLKVAEILMRERLNSNKQESAK